MFQIKLNYITFNQKRQGTDTRGKRQKNRPRYFHDFTVYMVVYALFCNIALQQFYFVSVLHFIMSSNFSYELADTSASPQKSLAQSTPSSPRALASPGATGNNSML
jgi:hypothetical protein